MYTSWASSQYLTEEFNMPPISLEGNSVRQIIHTSIGAKQIRFKFSNKVGKSKMEIKQAYIAKAYPKNENYKIYPQTNTKLTFNNGNSSVIIEAGEEIYTDLVDFSFEDLDELAISLYFGKVPAELTGHPGSRTLSYFMEGEHLTDEIFSTKDAVEHWYVIASLDVETESEKKVLVCFGDSITDGRGTTQNLQNRWTDIISERLIKNPLTKNFATINHGIGGTCLTSSGIKRFDTDVLKTNGISHSIILYGINDINCLNCDADTLINTYKNLIKKLHEKNIIAIGGTILPYMGNSDYTEERNQVRKAVNQWIKTTSAEDGGYDAYIDFAQAMGEENNKIPEANENDGLHPTANGYKTMGNCISLDFFEKDLESYKKYWK